jgi:hypothetical protein
MDIRNSLLSRALVENALFSGATGLGLVIGARWLDGWLGLNAWLLAAVGVGLLVYAADLAWLSRSEPWLIPGGRLAVVADIGWIIAAVALIAFTAVLTTPGELALALVSLVVAGFATAQWIGLRRLSTDQAPVVRID